MKGMHKLLGNIMMEWHDRMMRWYYRMMRWYYWKSQLQSWTAYIFVYGALFLFVILGCYGIFSTFNLFHTEANSARYMLSALVQSQAAIIAIVLILTQIVIQLTPQYSSRVAIDSFKMNPNLWLLLSSYILSMVYGLIVLKLIEGKDGEVVSQSAEYFVSFALWLGVFTYLALLPYMMNIRNLVNPTNYIRRLLKNITKDQILDQKEDIVQPIVEIIRGSVKAHDLATTRFGLNGLVDRAVYIIDSKSEEPISKYFCFHLKRIGIFAAGIADGESTIEVIKMLEIFGETVVNNGLEEAPEEATMSLAEVGKAAAEFGLADATSQAISSLGMLGKAAADKRLESATMGAVLSLGMLGKAAAEFGLADATRQAALFLGTVGAAAAKGGLVDATREAVWSLLVIGTVSVEKELKETAEEAANSLATLTILRKEIVETTISDYEKRLEGLKLKNFQKFKKFME